MNVVSSGPFSVASLVWQPKHGTFVLTVVAKVTYRLIPGISPLAEHQEEPNQDDSYWNDDLTRSVFAPADLVPYKPRADVLLVGHAFAPRQEPVRSLLARLVVAGVDKTIEVRADRSLLPDGTVREGLPFSKMPIRYERAAAGATNPVGVRSDARGDRFGGVPLPNLQPPGLPQIHRGDAIPPIGFGPIAPTWPARLAKLPAGSAQLLGNFSQYSMPEGLDPLYFNAAPSDQQVDQLHADEGLLLENLNIQHPILRTNLQGMCPKAVVERGGPPEELPMSLDTLWIDTDSGLCTVTWRGQLRLDDPDAPGRILVSTIKKARRESYPSLPSVPETSIPQAAPVAPNSSPSGAPPEAEAILRALGNKRVSEFEDTTMRPTRTKGPALPFSHTRPEQPPSAAPERTLDPSPKPIHEPSGETVVALPGSPGGPVLPFSHGSEATPYPAPEVIPATSAPNLPQPPAMVRPQPSTGPIAPAIGNSPWAAGLSTTTPSSMPQSTVEIVAPPLPQSALPRAHGEKEPRAAAVPAASAASSFAISSPTEGSPTAPKVGSLKALKQPGVGSSVPPSGAAAASNAAADPKDIKPRAAALPSSSRSHAPIELLWFDRAFTDAIRKEQSFKSTLAYAKPAAAPKPDDKKPPTKSASSEVDPREEVASICALGEPCSVEGLTAAMNAAIDERGIFSPPVVLIGGDVEFPFDEVETLKATVAAITPLAAGDKKLKETVDAIEELLKTPWLQSAGSVTERLTAQAKEAFASGNRLLAPGYLESHTERILLEQRHYQKRTLLGQVWIRALLASVGSSSRVPTYLPQALARELPMFQRFPARLIAEVRPQLDQYETSAIALRVVALARVLGLPGRP